MVWCVTEQRGGGGDGGGRVRVVFGMSSVCVYVCVFVFVHIVCVYMYKVADIHCSNKANRVATSKKEKNINEMQH